MSKYAPANESGDKPFVVTGIDWGRSVTRVIYAPDSATARYNSGLRGTGQYVQAVRRATPDDLIPSERKSDQ